MIDNMNQEANHSTGFWRRIADQFGLDIFFNYRIPEEANAFWHSIGGLLGISIAFQFLTGFLLLIKYIPDAGLAFSVTGSLLHSPTWKIVLNFHFWNAYLIFGLLMLHLMRVFISGAYRGNKRGLWLVGVILAALVFVAYLTGEALHWDEVGFAVPWHISEFLQAIHLADFFNYSFATLLSIPGATVKLVQLYGLHVAVVPVLLALFIVLHYFLVKEKGVSLPFWKKPTGRKVHFTKQVALHFKWSLFLLGSILLISAFVPRGAGIAPQLLPESPFYGAAHGPGALGAKPTFPISWTHGMNVFAEEHLGVTPDIWGTAVGMTLMFGALLLVPFADREKNEPTSIAEALNWRKRGLAFLLIALFWVVFLIGVIQNAVAGAG